MPNTKEVFDYLNYLFNYAETQSERAKISEISKLLAEVTDFGE